jgi:glycosyltransferase involved in cell wall biosynthesis
VRVCHFVASVGLGRGDAFVDLANALCEEDEVWILAPQGARFAGGLDPRVQLMQYHRRNRRSNPLLYMELFSILRKIAPDLVHTHFAKATGIFHLLNKALRLPWVATKHNPRKGKIYNRIEQVIAVSREVGGTVSHSRVRVIHNGISPVLLPPAEKRSGSFRILSVGRLEQVKGFDRLIEACANLPFDFRLKVVGDGPEMARLVDLTRKAKLGGKIEFLGYRTDVPELMQQADVIVVSSHSEGFSMVILEGLFYGKVLVSRRVGIAENLLDERFLIEDYAIASKLMEVHADPDGFQAAFEELRITQGPKYLITHAVEEHRELYRGLVAARFPS